MNAQDEIKELKQRIAELEELAKEEHGFPQDGHWYWYITSDAGVGMSSWGEFEFEKEQLSIGNIFRTKQEAQFALEKLKVEAELRKFSRPYKEGGYNYTLNYNHKKKGVVHICENTSFQVQGALYFESRDTLERAIESVGEERIKKYIFGVED